MVDFECKERYDLSDYRRIISLLRGEGGCPWDREQTHESIRRNLLEEACEVCEAIDEKDPEHLREELGDLLMQVLFHADMESDAGRFDLDDVADTACKKLILRHPQAQWLHFHPFQERMSCLDMEFLAYYVQCLGRRIEQHSTYQSPFFLNSKLLSTLLALRHQVECFLPGVIVTSLIHFGLTTQRTHEILTLSIVTALS